MANLQQAIAYFEEILRIMPHDRAALEFLAVTYQQVGDEAKRSRVTAALADVLLAEGDLKSADALRPTLREIGTAEARAAAQRIDARLRPPAAVRPVAATEAKKSPDENDVFAAVKSELELLRQLRSRNDISSQASDLAEKALFDLLSEGGLPLVSALAAVEHEDPAECERAIAALADATGCAPVPLESFAPDPELARLLPARLLFVRGAVPFARLADTLLVAVLNPTDRVLLHEISDRAGGPCRYYLALPSAVEGALDALRAEGGTP